MEDPPGSPKIKTEPHDNPDGPPPINTGEIINLISDDEDGAVAPANVPTLGSPFHEQPHESEAVNLGPSIMSTKPKPAKPSEKESKDALKAKRERLQAMIKAKQKETTDKHRIAGQAQAKQRTPLVGRSDLFVTESNPGTPDPAEIFRVLQREIDEKRRDGTLTWQEELQFERDQATEKARVLKERLDQAYDGSDASVAGEEDPRLSPSVASLPDEDDEEPKKRGRKRKADPISKPQPKKRQAAPKSAEDILVTARRKPKPTAPDLLNTASMLGSNVFADTARMRDVPDQPTFGPDHDKGKDKALRSLIASVPEEYRPVAKTDKKFLEDAMKDFTGRGAVTPAEDGNWNVKGLRVTLKHYQVLGVAFMRRRENSTVEPKGGILADSMGLGKTITMLANIVNGKSLQKNKCRTTLIVASAALVSQWRREITEKVYTDRDNKHGLGRVKEFSGQLRSNQEEEELMECDIVLTTYTQVQKSYPKADIPPEYTTAEQKNEWWKNHYAKERGVLHKIKWLRIVLDESQAIKNHKSLTSMACRALSAKHNWAISGTPLMNGIDEFYSIFKFIKEPHGASSMKLFRKNFCSNDDSRSMEKLDVFLRKFMIRRTHLDTLFNARLLDLPTPQELVLWLDFNEVERNVYEIVKSRFIKRINCISKAGDLDKQYGHIWTMLLRLRQLTSHVLLVQGTITDLLEREDFERLYKIASDDLSEESEALLTHLREKLKNSVGAPRVDGRQGATIVAETETIPNHRTGYDAGLHDVGGVHGLTYKFDRYLDDWLNSESWEAIASRTLCCGCRQPPLDPMVTSCFHVYCCSCLKDMQHSFARRALDRHRCNECGSYYTDARKCQKSLQKFSGAYDNITGSAEGEGLSITGKGKKAKLQSWISMRGEVLPSTKTIAVKSQILNWIEEDPDVKIIVYSQWIPMLHVLGRICQTEGWNFEKYTGHMSHDSRDRAIKSFGDPLKKTRILLASLKCGGLGLNLTMANRVITLDPWWNYSVEQQAFCRVFRIGQQKEAHMARLVVKGTIDEAIYALQGTKQRTIDEALDESQRKERLSIKELMQLFGQVGESEDGKPFIFAHEDELDDKDDDSSHSTPPPRAADHASDDEGDGLDDDV